MLQTLSQRRYLGLFGLMVVVAALCALAGTWQVSRFNQKRDYNDHYRANNRAPIADVTAVLGAPQTAAQLAALHPTGRQRDAAKFRRITATGSYLADRQSLLRGQTINNDVGYLVITPLQTSSGVLLVSRGFITQNNAADTSPRSIPAPPTGVVTVQARLQPASATSDRYGALPGVQVDTVNAADQASRLAAPVFDGYAELLADQPGGQNLTALPPPDMSNPAGGAEEPQHAAYVVQWYIFGGLALAAPFVLAAAERRRDSEAAGVTTQVASLDDRLAGRA